MKSVLILANHDVGLYNFRVELVERLIREGFDVHFSVPFGEKVPLLELLGAVYHPVELNRRGKNPVQDLKLLGHYFKLIREVSPIAVLSYTAKPNIYGGLACRMAGVAQLANITGLGSELNGNGKAAKLIRGLYKIGLKKARTVFFQNESNHAYFIENGLVLKDGLQRPFWPGNDYHETLQTVDVSHSAHRTPRAARRSQRSIILPGSGVNTHRFAPPEGKLFSPSQTARFLFISRIMQDKGIDEFLTAAETVKSQYPGCSFRILGFYESDTYKERIERLIARGIIDASSFSEDTRVQMTDADCVVLPSYHEGMSNVLLEAAAYGLPVIATDISGCREVVQHGVSGYLCEKKNAESLADQMVRLVLLDASEKEAMGQAGRLVVVQNFDRELVVQAYLREILAIMG